MTKQNYTIKQKGFIPMLLIGIGLFALAIIVLKPAYSVKKIEHKVQSILAIGHEAKANARFKLLEWQIKDIVFERDNKNFDEVADEAEDFREEAKEAIHDIREITETGDSAHLLKERFNELVENELKELNIALEQAPSNAKEAISKEIVLSEELLQK